MNTALNSTMLEALTKYGIKENLCLKEDLKRHWDENLTYETVTTNISKDIDLRHKLINQGRILEENLEKHYYYWLIQINGLFAPEALVITQREENIVYIAAYANQGAASKHFTIKACAQVKEALLK